MNPLQTGLPNPPGHSKNIGLGSEALGMGWDGTSGRKSHTGPGTPEQGVAEMLLVGSGDFIEGEEMGQQQWGG